MDFAKLISECEADVRSGRLSHALGLLSEVKATQVPRPFRLPLANICRRAGQVNLGLRLLTPLLYPHKGSGPADASLAEQAEYAVLLQRSGATQEALTLLHKIPVEKVPEVSLYICTCLFNLWEYAEAIAHLQRFLSSRPTDYMKLVAEVNLASALLFTDQLTEAFDLLTDLNRRAEEQGAQRLRANSFEMMAQIYLRQEDFERADQALLSAESLLNRASTHDQLFIQKWKAIAQSRRTASSEPLHEFRILALAAGESEAVRDADLYTLGMTFDPLLFQRLYFGTPFMPYRARMCRILQCPPPAGPRYFGELGRESLDLTKPSGKVDAILGALLVDFYKPQQVGTLFKNLFPDEHFNIFSSPGRVRQLIYRLRQILQEDNLPLQVVEKDARYHLILTAPFSIQLPIHSESFNTPSVAQLEDLRQKLAERTEFSSREAQEIWGVSAATCKRIIQRAMHSGQLLRFGAGVSTRYYFPEAARKAG